MAYQNLKKMAGPNFLSLNRLSLTLKNIQLILKPMVTWNDPVMKLIIEDIK
jgi:hypothetical protein